MNDVLDGLPPIERLAASYAPASLRPLWLGYFALEQRLADAAREGRDTIMIQLRLAWWRDRLGESPDRWPKGEPLLALLQPWHNELPALVALVDGREVLHAGEGTSSDLDEARVGVMQALGRMSGAGHEDDISAAAREWAGLASPGRTAPRLPRAMRPLAVLRGLALRGDAGSPIGRFALALRLGLLGR